MSEDSDNFVYSDDDIDDKKHQKLVENLLNLDKAQNIKKPARSEATLKISEFDLVKSATGNKGSVQLNELTKVLKGKKLSVISNKVQSTKKKAQTLPAPLEKPQSERIKRSVNYEKTRLDFDRWEAFVSSNRSQPQQVFPLDSVKKVKIKDKEPISERWRLKTDLDKEFEKLEPKVEVFNIETEENDDFPLTLEELKEKRKEAAKLRVHQSFKEAKARRQNKIKSKKYHRILRKEKIKEKLKEFEELQKTNPEEALKKLEDIEKARAEERFSLRHKSTGQWARNKQIRAKYNKESRQELAQQLSVSRELTQKVQVNSDSEEEYLETEQNVDTSKKSNDLTNPWINTMKADKEVVDFVSGYRKYWSDNKNGQEIDDNIKKDSNNIEKNENKISNIETGTEKSKKVKKTTKNIQKATKNTKKSKKVTKNKRKVQVENSSGDWNVDIDIDNLFDKLENKISKKINKKTKITSTSDTKTKKSPTKKQNKKTKTKTTKFDLSIPKKHKKQIIDEQLLENPHRIEHSHEESNINKLKQILEANTTEITSNNNVDPNKFINVKQSNLENDIPDLAIEDDNADEDNSQKKLIMEAFEDDDIIRDFNKEKKDEVNQDNPKNIDLNLPGWGSWAGTNINSNKRKRKRFIIKMPEKIPRRDDNKGTLIINEKAESKIRELQVSEVPFPFKRVQDYEASIRAPIGNTFVPQTAFKKLIQPSVVTKMGTIIEPVKKSMVFNGK